MIVEERYSFFQIENKLRSICQDAVDAIRTRITKEADIVRKVQMMAEQAKRDVSTVEPRLEKALQANQAVQKAFNEITGLESAIRIESERNSNALEMMETNMSLMEGKMQSQTQNFNAEMTRLDDTKNSVKIALDQIQEFKDSLTKRIDKEITGYRDRVAELELP